MRWYSLLLILALTACGGASVVATQPATSSPDASARATQGTNAATEYGSLWVAWGPTVVEYDVDAALSRTHKRTPVKEIFGVVPSSPGVDRAVWDAAVGSDGTYYALVDSWTYPSTSLPTWELRIYAPGASGADPYEQIITGTGLGTGVALDDDAIDVLVEDDFGASSGYLASYRYASGNHPSPIRMLTFPYAPSHLALDQRNRLYVRGGASVFVYPAHLNGAAPPPLRTIALPPGDGTTIGLGPKGDLWTLAVIDIQSTAFVYGLAANNNGPVPDVTIRRPWAVLRGIAVDANDTVYVGNESVVDMYPQNATTGGTEFKAPSSTAAAPLGQLTTLTVGPAVHRACARICRRPQDGTTAAL